MQNNNKNNNNKKKNNAAAKAKALQGGRANNNNNKTKNNVSSSNSTNADVKPTGGSSSSAVPPRIVQSQVLHITPSREFAFQIGFVEDVTLNTMRDKLANAKTLLNNNEKGSDEFKQGQTDYAVAKKFFCVQMQEILKKCCDADPKGKPYYLDVRDVFRALVHQYEGSRPPSDTATVYIVVTKRSEQSGKVWARVELRPHAEVADCYYSAKFRMLADASPKNSSGFYMLLNYKKNTFKSEKIYGPLSKPKKSGSKPSKSTQDSSSKSTTGGASSSSSQNPIRRPSGSLVRPRPENWADAVDDENMQDVDMMEGGAPPTKKHNTQQNTRMTFPSQDDE